LEDLAELTRRHTKEDVTSFARHDLRPDTGRAHELSALAGLELDVVHDGTGRDEHQGQRVAGLDVRLVARNDGCTDLEADGRQDVALLAVDVLQERDARRAVRVVLDRHDLGGHVDLVTLEVDDAVAALVATTLEAHRDAAFVVTTALVLERTNQR